MNAVVLEVIHLEKVSVIMPCFNDGIYIQEAIDSVLNQTYQNIELIIIDDGSDDLETKRILKEISDERIKVLESFRLRPAGARNLGIQEATGKYILPVDSDDRIAPTYIEKAITVLENNKNIGVVYCYAELFGEQTGKWDLPDYKFEHMLLDNIVFVTSMFRKEDWEQVGGFKTNMEHGMEDYDFWLSILELGREIYQIPETLFYYRIKPQSRTTEFMENSEVVKATYHMIYDNHIVFFEQYARGHALALRDALIDHIFMNRALVKTNAVVDKLAKIPLLKRIVKSLITKG